MGFEEIMQEITGGLTGEREHDMPYLKEQCRKYRGHKLAREILRACGRLLYQLEPAERRAELNTAFQNDKAEYQSVLEETSFKIYQEKYDEALALLEPMIKRIEKDSFFNDDSVSEYKCFSEFFEEALYNHYCSPRKTLRRPPLPYDAIYFQYGSLLIDLNRITDARAALKTALHWNPASADIAFEHAETYKMTGDMETYFQLSVSTFQYAFYPRQVARCYRNLGYYFIEKNLYKVASACYKMSLQFEKDSRQAMSELYFIYEKTGGSDTVSAEDWKAYSERYGFPAGAHEDVVGLALAYGMRFLKEQQTAGARYCLSIAYALTDDEEIKQFLDSLPQTESGENPL